jgi:hypothetical protein
MAPNLSPVEIGFIDFLFRKRDLLRARVAGRDDREMREMLALMEDMLAGRERPALAKLKPIKTMA